MLNQLRKLRSKGRDEFVSPLKDDEVSALRYPGQSIQYTLDKKLMDIGIQILAVTTCFIVVVQAWLFYFLSNDLRAYAWLFTIVAVILCAFLIPSIFSKYQDAKRLRRASNGERIVAEHLNQLIADGYAIFHDIPCEYENKNSFNIDHLLVGKQGIFAIETKTMSKRKREGEEKEHELMFDGQQILRFGTHPLKKDPVKQAKNQAAQLQRILAKATGQHFEVTPVVTFPGWYVKDGLIRPEYIYVFGTPTPKATRRHLLNRQEKLSEKDIIAVKDCIKQQIQDHRP